MRERAGSDNERQVVAVAFRGMLVNLILVAAKLVGGLWGGSQALVADSVHSLTDFSTDIMIIWGAGVWGREADRLHPHGHKRVETLVTFGIGLVLAGAGIGVLWNAAATFFTAHGASEVKPVALAAALASIIIKEGLFQWTARRGRQLKSMPLVANAWHHRSDALSSIPVAVAVLTAMLVPNLAFVDHIGAILVSGFIFQASFKILWESVGKLVDKGVPPQEIDAIERLVTSVDGVKGVHKIRSRYLGCVDVQVDLHLLVDGAISVADGHAVSEVVQNKVKDNIESVVDVVVHVEPYQKLG